MKSVSALAFGLFVSGLRDATGRLSAGADTRTGRHACRGTRRLRGGVSLLEVLISIGVLSIGLLGVAAVIPVARFQMVEAAKAERSAAAGQAMLRHAKVWGMLESQSWLDVFNANPSTPNLWTVSFLTFPTRNASFVIDPLFVAANAKDPSSDPYALNRVRSFPYWPTNYDPTARNPAQQMYLHECTMRRGTLDQTVRIPPAVPNSVAGNILRQLIVSQRNCTWRDDLVIPVPKDRDERPRQVMLCNFDDGGTLRTVSAALPARPEDFSTGALPPGLGALVPETAGNYTWMVTVSPDVGENYTIVDPDPGTFGDEYPAIDLTTRRVFTVSVVVFYKRDISNPSVDPSKPSERTVMATFLGGGYGGGDVRLVAPPPPGDYSEYLDVKEGEWLLLAGTEMHSLEPAYVRRFVFHWYRIAAAGQIELPGTSAPGPSRVVTLEGPDWDTEYATGWCLRYNPATGRLPNPGGAAPYAPFTDMNGDGLAQDVQACLLDGVIGVYTTTVELE